MTPAPRVAVARSLSPRCPAGEPRGAGPLMSRVAEMWRTFTDEERDAVYYALRAALHDDGRFALAVIADARGEPETLTADDSGTCHDCAGWAEHLTAWLVEEHGAQRALWCCPGCYIARLLHQHHEPRADELHGLHRPGEGDDDRD